MRTRITLGSLSHAACIDGKWWELLKQFVTLPPAVVGSASNLVTFEIPPMHASGLASYDRTYSVTTDTRCLRTWTETSVVLEKPLTFITRGQADAKSFDRVTITREAFDNDSFLLSDDATYSHAVFIKDRVDATIEGWGYQWTVRMDQKWVCPYYELHRPEDIVFRCRPMYSATVMTTGSPTLDVIHSFIQTALPRAFRDIDVRTE